MTLRVVVAGGSGFLGRHVVAQLREQGHDVVVLARNPEPASSEGVTSVACDVGAGPPPRSVLEDCDAIVNLVGIAQARGANTFERVHIDAVRHLIEASRDAGVRRLVHVSVVSAREGPSNPYLDTKARAEVLVRESDLEYTILRPGLIYGRGDQMLSNLVRGIRVAPVFPAPGGGRAIHQVVDARDVALAIVRSLERPETIGNDYDIVGPERLTFRELLARVAAGMGLWLWVVGVPASVMRVLVRIMEAVLPTPLLTRAQLEMLVEGLSGDGGPASRDLGLEPRPLSKERVAELEPTIGELAPSVRLVTSRGHREWLASHVHALARVELLVPAALAAMLVMPSFVTNTWHRMAMIEGGLIVVSLAVLRLRWRELLRPSLPAIAQGLVGAVVLYGLGWATMVGLQAAAPAAGEQLGWVYGMRSMVSPTIAAILLPLVVAGEDIFWRAAITLPIAARLGAWRGCLIAAALFAGAHVTSGPLLLVFAAFGAGLVWSWLLVRTRSLFATIASHLMWDVAVIWLVPY